MKTYKVKIDGVDIAIYQDDDGIFIKPERFNVGTALKPATEIFTLARKPLSEKTIAENVLKWGTGGINIDGCRIPTTEIKENNSEYSDKGYWGNADPQGEKRWSGNGTNNPQGRFPPNVILDGSKEVRDCFPETKSTGGKANQKPSKANTQIYGFKNYKNMHTSGEHFNDSGSAARFFYCAKASRRERSKANDHPTVKPIKLMKYLVKLITPSKGICLDLYAGSGSTVFACIEESFNFVAIEIDPEYCKIANQRINNAQLSLF